jgi:hypothetical protein
MTALMHPATPNAVEAGATKKPSKQTTKAEEKPSARKIAHKPEYRRHVIELHPDFDDILERLRLLLRLRSKTDVIQKAIQLMAVVVGDGEEEKRQLYLAVDGKTRELVIV